VAGLEELRPILPAWVLLAGAVGVPVTVLWLVRPGVRHWPPQRRRAVPWDGALVLASFLSLWVWLWFISLFTGGLLERHPDMGQLGTPVLAFPAQVATILMLFRMAGGELYQLGLAGRRHLRDLVAGYGVWLVLTPAVFIGYAVVLWAYQRWTGGKPPEHPLTRIIQAQPTALEWVLVVFQAILVAPVIEELLFRGLLQAWLVRHPLGWVAILVGALGFVLLGMGGPQASWGPVVYVFLLTPGVLVCVFVGRRWFAEVGALPAIYCTALLFGAFHSGVWPTPIPLFVLGLGLGWLAYRTQGIVGPITVHALFNAVTCLALALQHGSPGETKGKETTSATRPPSVVSTSNRVPGSWLPRRTKARAIGVPSRGEKVDEVIWPTSLPSRNSFVPPGAARSPDNLRPTS
jgi:membrane protease YdiL (CAAX protease family)